MAELTPGERLLPSLLDRLTDDRPGHQEESREQRAGSEWQLRQSVLRDLEALLNTVNLESDLDFSAHQSVAGTVLNYGMPALSGNTLQSTDRQLLERQIKRCIEAFEPRILKRGLKVSVVDVEPEDNAASLVFEIEGTLWGRPMPEALYLRTEIDLELGSVVVEET